MHIRKATPLEGIIMNIKKWPPLEQLRSDPSFFHMAAVHHHGLGLDYKTTAQSAGSSDGDLVRFSLNGCEVRGGSPDNFGRGFNLVVLAEDGRRAVQTRCFDTYSDSGASDDRPTL